MVRTSFVLLAALAVAGCAATPAAMTFGEVPRDGRGLPVWSIVVKKASRPELIPAAYRPDPAVEPRDHTASGEQS